MPRNQPLASDGPRRPGRRTPADIAVAGLLAAAGGLHLAALPSHQRSSAIVAAFFAGTALAQLLGALLVATRPSRRLAGGVIAGNLTLVAIWALSRTTGLPVGGALGLPERVSVLDGLAAAVEVLALLAALWSLAARRPVVASVRSAGWQPVLAVGVLWLASGALGVTLPGSGHDHVSATPAGSTGHDHSTGRSGHPHGH